MLTDSPETERERDRFKRWPFAQRVAQAIISRGDRSSIGIGIYSAWGEGKTTVLNYIEKALAESSNAICVRFNPWRFRDEELLLRSFFHTLADKLEQSLSVPQEELGNLLEKYANILGSLALKFGDVQAQVSAVDLAKDALRVFSALELDDLKERIGNVLLAQGRRVVVFIDDIDHLERAEIQAVFKLVKLSADFKNTAYILAFDENIVAAALGEKYAALKQDSGINFLDKIIQVPLHLPKADTLSLRNLCLEGVIEALEGADIQLSEKQLKAFVTNFTGGLEKRLLNPRMAKRYVNALVFSLPILKGEVNPVDLMLIEGIRIFYPKLYDVIREHPDVFLGLELNLSHSAQPRERSINIINQGLEKLTIDEKDSAKYLIKNLFPRLNGIFEKKEIIYDSKTEDKWTEEQRVASKNYFARFFSYAVPEGDISDIELKSFLREIENKPIPDIASEIERFAGLRSGETLVLKLREKFNNFSIEVSRKLAIAISKIGNCFPNPETFISYDTAFSQAGIIVTNLVENIPNNQGRIEAAKTITQEGQPIDFSIECFLWMHTGKEEEEERERFFSMEEENELAKILVERIKHCLQDKRIQFNSPKATRQLLYVWSHWGSRKETNQYLTKILEQEPRNAIEILKCYLPTVLAVPLCKGDFEREQYYAVKEVVDADVIYKALYKIYGSVLDSPQYSEYAEDSDRSLDERVAHQFAYIHQQQSQVETEDIAEEVEY